MRSVPSLLLCVQLCMSNAMATKLLLRALRYSRIPVACLAICLAACVARGKLCASVFVVGMQQLASQVRRILCDTFTSAAAEQGCGRNQASCSLGTSERFSATPLPPLPQSRGVGKVKQICTCGFTMSCSVLLVSQKRAMCSTGSRHSAIRSAGSLGKLVFPLDLGRLIPTCCYFIVSCVPVARLACWCRFLKAAACSAAGKRRNLLGGSGIKYAPGQFGGGIVS